jgi:hypothetical protein
VLDIALMPRSQERIVAMDSHTIDRLAVIMSMPRSRRTTWRMLLGLALGSGAATVAGGRVSAAPKGSTPKTCTEGDGSCRGDECCGGTCCPGRCFEDPQPPSEEKRFYCCTEPEHVICGNPTAANPDEQQVCCPKSGTEPLHLCGR